MQIVLMALLAANPFAAPRTFVAHSSYPACAAQSICGWVKLGRTDMEATQVHNCVNVYENHSRRLGNGIGNPNLTFSETLVGIPNAGNSFEIWGKWVNPTNSPQALDNGMLEVSCNPGG